MTNKERWLSITDGLCSPQNMIDWGFRSMISCALQRRVWYGPEHLPCYPNQYVILFGKPGIGKSLVLDTVSDMLKHYKKKDVSFKNGLMTDAQKLVTEVTEKENLRMAEAGQVKSKAGMVSDPPLFPYAPDATTYEALVESIGMSLRRVNYTRLNGEGQPKLEITTHCSMYFCLDELGSLFRKKADAVMNFLLGLHGCPKLYEYKTKNSGEDRIINGCLNFIAGTTPDFMEEISNDKLIGNGFSARAIFVCANKNRKNVSSPPPLTIEQQEHKKELLEHLRKLALLYGPVTVDKETTDYIQEWWNDTENNPSKRPNRSAKMDSYYPRKNIHMYKVAMANHFGESTDMHLTLEEIKQAIADLDKEEPTMHLALMLDGSNPLTKVTNKIYDFIVKTGGANIADIMTEFWDNLPQGSKSLDEILPHLVAADKIKLEVEPTGEKKYKAL